MEYNYDASKKLEEANREWFETKCLCLTPNDVKKGEEKGHDYKRGTTYFETKFESGYKAESERGKEDLPTPYEAEYKPIWDAHMRSRPPKWKKNISWSPNLFLEIFSKYEEETLGGSAQSFFKPWNTGLLIIAHVIPSSGFMILMNNKELVHLTMVLPLQEVVKIYNKINSSDWTTVGLAVPLSLISENIRTIKLPVTASAEDIDAAILYLRNLDSTPIYEKGDLIARYKEHYRYKRGYIKGFAPDDTPVFS